MISGNQSSSVNCVTLARVIRGLGGGPVDMPSPRFSLKLIDESLADILNLVRSTQAHILASLETLLDEPELRTGRGALAQVRQIHKENIRWMKQLTGD